MHDTSAAADRTEAPPRAPKFKPLDAAGLYARGLAMGAADIVPGVSGGTIALVTGIYERFVAALGSLSPAFLAPLVRGKIKDANAEFWRMHWAVLVPLFAGILSAVVLMSRLITGLMADRPGATYAFFFGLILASAWAPFVRMKTRTWKHALAAVAAAAAAWGIVGLQPDGLRVGVRAGDEDAGVFVYPGKIRSENDLGHITAAAGDARVVLYDPKGILADQELSERVTRLADEDALEAWLDGAEGVGVLEPAPAPLWWIFVCGGVSISAMILPGLSGSFLMLLLGQYHNVTSAISRMPEHLKALLGSEPDALARLAGRTLTDDAVFLGVFACGVGLGLATFSRVVKWLFAHFHDVTMAALTGLMIGALRLPGTQVIAHSEQESWGLLIGVGVIGAALVAALTLYDLRASSRAS